ncbi:hypothetical protein HDU79_008410 [Rhizoclosmatium sp. JEL0117]|nr:hypothetical protein HDU79_008410 [Rhizoclosmatium sp. JEL0117]
MLFSALTKNDWEKAMADSPNESRNSSETSSGTAAELLYGPLQISNSREALKSLPSIRGTQAMQYVDDMSDAFLAQSKSSSGKEIRKQVIRLLYSRTKILDACSPIDRLKAIEIMEATKNQFKVHMDHMYAMYGSSAPRNNYGSDVRHGSPHGSHSSGGGNNSNNNAAGSASPSSAILEVFEETFNKQSLSSHISGPPTPNLNTLKKAMNLVPSLTNHPIIDELCNLFEFQARCTDPKERCETIFKFIDVRNKISDVCKTEEEKMQFHIAMEIGRAENRSLVEEMYRSVESSLQEHERIAGFTLGKMPPKRKPAPKDDDEMDPAERHKVANREAQRKFRERKENRIKELEAQVEQLQAQLDIKSSSSDHPPPASSSASSELNTLKSEVAQLRSRVNYLEAENTELNRRLESLLPPAIPTPLSNPPHPYYTSTSDISYAPPIAPSPLTSTLKPQSASEIYGVPVFGSLLHDLKSLPSLQNSTDVDSMVNLFVDQSQLRDSFQIRKRIFLMLKYKYRILEACSMVDRLKAIEIMEKGKRVHAAHLLIGSKMGRFVKKHMDDHWEGLTLSADDLPEIPASEQVSLQLDNFKRILEFVPSLAGHEHLVNNMFKLFIVCGPGLVDLKNKLFSLCKSEEDCNRFSLALEIGRQNNKGYVEDLFEQVEAILERPPLFVE